MFISAIDLRQFRNLAPQRIEFQPGLTVIVGHNGHGKTSLLEAIYMLSQPRSFRGARPRELIQWQQSKDQSGVESAGCRVSAQVETAAGTVEVGYEIEQGNRSVFVNGKQVTKLGSFLGRVTTVEFTPDELSLLKGPPSNRRQFLDKTLAMIKPGYIEQLVSYNRAVKNRNKVLASLAGKGVDIEGGAAERLLKPWEEAMVDYGQAVVQARSELTNDLIEPLQRAHTGLAGTECGPGGVESVSLEYRSGFLKDNRLRSADELRSQLIESRDKDLKYRSTTIGAHHDDLEVYLHSPSDAGKSGGREVTHGGASQGQIRSAALALKLASAGQLKYRTGDAPILLLDDVESELDQQRRERLYELILGLGHQVFVTTTDLSRSFAGTFPQARILTMDKGRIY